MKPTRKPRSDSTKAAIEAMVNASLPLLQPPAHVRLRPQDRPFWEAIIASRARGEWSPTDLVVAAQLARCQADIETESERLDAEGSVLENARGTPVMNPRHSVLEQLARKELALMRSVSLIVQVRIRDQTSTRRTEMQAREANAALAGEELLA
jgi:hypothetical protein